MELTRVQFSKAELESLRESLQEIDLSTLSEEAREDIESLRDTVSRVLTRHKFRSRV